MLNSLATLREVSPSRGVQDDGASSELLGRESGRRQNAATQPDDTLLRLPPLPRSSGIKRPRSTPANNTVQDASFVASSDEDDSSDVRWRGSFSRGNTTLKTRPCATNKRRCVEKEPLIRGTSETIPISSTDDEHDIDVRIEGGLYVRVSRGALTQVPYFEKYFSKKWEHADYNLLEDDTQAICVLLAIIHHKPSKLPVSMSTNQLFDLATVCDKYDVTDIALPHVVLHGWIDALWEEKLKPCDGKWEPWLWILSVFSKPRTDLVLRRERVLDVLAANMTQQEGRWVFGKDSTFCYVSDIESPNDLDPLDRTLELRRNTIWKSLRDGWYRKQKTLLNMINRDFPTVGVIAALLDKADGELTSGKSLTEELRVLTQFLSYPAQPQKGTRVMVEADLRRYEV